MAAINNLLRKKHWTGDDAGKAIIYSLIHSYQQTTAGTAHHQELFSAVQLQKMLASLQDKEQIKLYNGYVGLNNWLTQFQAVALAYYQQAEGEIARIQGILATAQALEYEYRYIESLPLIVTRKQYDEIKAMRFQELSVPHHAKLSDVVIFAGNRRAVRNGVAILNTTESPSGIDENGHYIEPDPTNNMGVSGGLEQFTPLHPDHNRNTARQEQSRAAIEEGYRYLLGYDTAIGLISTHIGIPDFAIFKTGADGIALRIDKLNQDASFLRMLLDQTDYQDSDIKEAKRWVMDAYFPPIQWDKIAISQAAIQEAREMLIDFKAFEKQDGVFIGLLTQKREED